MKKNRKYIYIAMIICIIGVAFFLNIIINQGKESGVKEVASENIVDENDEILNKENSVKSKGNKGKVRRNVLRFEIEEDLSKKEVRNELANEIVIAKILKIDGATNINPLTGEETVVSTYGELEILNVLKGNLKENNKVKFNRAGGRMKYEDYIRGSKAAKEKILSNPELDRRENNTIEIEEYNEGDIELEEGKTYLMYMNFERETNSYLIDFYQYGTREIENIRRSVLKKSLLNYRKNNKPEGVIRVKNNETGEYENIENVV